MLRFTLTRTARLWCLALLLAICLSGFTLPAFSAETTPQDAGFSLACKSAVLMEATTGRVLYAQNAEEALPPASVTKIMTLLLVMEAIENGKLSFDTLVSTSETAASMGGSQIYLEVGETMTVEELLKSVVISSANDAAVALAEAVAGDVGSFVKQMNERARELGMSATTFENVTGLDDTAQNHLTSALDIARMSRALIEHEKILEYSSIWMDTIRGGAFGLTNTNRLVRFYRGATGLKTGSTSKAGFCVSATAERDGLSLICVIMGAETRDIRNAQATKLLDWGFANYAVYHEDAGQAPDMTVTGGISPQCPVAYDEFYCVLPKNDLSRVTKQTEQLECKAAPVRKGEIVGSISYTLDGEVIGKVDMIAQQDVPRIGFFGVWQRLIAKILLK